MERALRKFITSVVSIIGQLWALTSTVLALVLGGLGWWARPTINACRVETLQQKHPRGRTMRQALLRRTMPRSLPTVCCCFRRSAHLFSLIRIAVIARTLHATREMTRIFEDREVRICLGLFGENADDGIFDSFWQ